MAEQLESRYGALFTAQVSSINNNRQGQLPFRQDDATQECAVDVLGSHFKLLHYDAPVRSLLRALQRMHTTFMHPERLARFREHLQLLRLVAAPGMGKVRVC